MTTLPTIDETSEMVQLFRLAPPDMLKVTICQFRRFYFIAKHQDLSGYAELYAEAIRQLGGEVRFNTAEEAQLIG